MYALLCICLCKLKMYFMTDFKFKISFLKSYTNVYLCEKKSIFTIFLFLNIYFLSNFFSTTILPKMYNFLTTYVLSWVILSFPVETKQPLTRLHSKNLCIYFKTKFTQKNFLIWFTANWNCRKFCIPRKNNIIIEPLRNKQTWIMRNNP